MSVLITKTQLTFHLVMMVYIIPPIHPCDHNEVFDQEPGPGIVKAPTGKQLDIYCMPFPEYRVESWEIFFLYLNRTRPTSTTTKGVLEVLSDRGITVEGMTVNMSTIVINGTEENNRTSYACEVIEKNDPTLSCISQHVVVMFYGPPSTPTDLRFTKLTPSTLKFNWSSVAIGLPVTFIVRIINLNKTNALPILTRGIEDKHYVFITRNNADCHMYKFVLTASNSAGNSNASEIIFKALPSVVPNLRPIQNSIQHTLVKNAREANVILTISFDDTTLCKVNYTLVLEHLTPRRQSTLTTNTGHLTVQLQVDALYRYHIMVVNAIGAANTSVVSIRTTDVIDVIITMMNSTTFSIQCHYITGSDARGCIYSLMGGNSMVRDIIGTIERSNSRGVYLQLIGCYITLKASDWEKDNSTGTLPITKNIYLGTCPVTTTTETPNPNQTLNIGTQAITTSETYVIGVISGTIIGGLIVVSIIIAVIVFLLFRISKIKKSRVRNQRQLYDSEGQEEQKNRKQERKRQEKERKKLEKKQKKGKQQSPMDKLYSTLTPERLNTGMTNSFVAGDDEVEQTPHYHVLECTTKPRLIAGIDMSTFNTFHPVGGEARDKNMTSPEREMKCVERPVAHNPEYVELIRADEEEDSSEQIFTEVSPKVLVQSQ